MTTDSGNESRRPPAERVAALARFVRDRAERGSDELPAFPGVATRLVDLLEQPDAELREVEALVAQDAAVSAQVLRMANSLMYGGAMRIESIPHAVMRLGFRETAQVAMSAACRALFSLEDRAESEVFPELGRALWVDSLVASHGARLIAREIKRGQPERVYLGAMFRDLGTLLVLKVVARGLVRGRLRAKPDETLLRQVVELLHADLGARYLRRAHLPEDVVQTVARHHAVDLPFDAETVDLHVVRVADGLVDRIGLSPFATGDLGPLALESAFQFGLSAERLDYFSLQFEELAAQLRALA
ncbi:MAG: HDOD domain-containing protein [Myxococcota bacterium]